MAYLIYSWGVIVISFHTLLIVGFFLSIYCLFWGRSQIYTYVYYRKDSYSCSQACSREYAQCSLFFTRSILVLLKLYELVSRQGIFLKCTFCCVGLE